MGNVVISRLTHADGMAAVRAWRTRRRRRVRELQAAVASAPGLPARRQPICEAPPRFSTLEEIFLDLGFPSYRLRRFHIADSEPRQEKEADGEVAMV